MLLRRMYMVRNGEPAAAPPRPPHAVARAQLLVELLQRQDCILLPRVLQDCMASLKACLLVGLLGTMLSSNPAFSRLA